MTTAEQEQPQFEQRSKIKVVRNAKGDAQWEVTVIAGDSVELLDAMRGHAVAQYRALAQELGQ